MREDLHWKCTMEKNHQNPVRKVTKAFRSTRPERNTQGAAAALQAQPKEPPRTYRPFCRANLNTFDTYSNS